MPQGYGVMQNNLLINQWTMTTGRYIGRVDK